MENLTTMTLKHTPPPKPPRSVRNPGAGENTIRGGQTTATAPTSATETALQVSGNEMRDKVSPNDPPTPTPGGNQSKRLAMNDLICQKEELSSTNQGSRGQGGSNSLNLYVDSDTSLEGNDVLRAQGITTNHKA